MKYISFLSLFVIILVLLLSCAKDDDLSLANSYLPLEKGNYWKLDILSKREIVGTKKIDDKFYYSIKIKDDTIYYRIDNNKVYVLHHQNNESIKFDFSANINDTWDFNSWKVKLISKTDTVIVNDTKFLNCFQFYFDTPIMADESHSIWLAPNVGFVQEDCEDCFPGIFKIDKAKVNDKVIDY